MTRTPVTGTIPTEIGLLSNLKYINFCKILMYAPYDAALIKSNRVVSYSYARISHQRIVRYNSNGIRRVDVNRKLWY